MKKVVVVGGGIAGLSAAYELSKGGAEVTLVEKNRLGGIIKTERSGDFVIEGGPDSFLSTKPWAKELCEELGLADQLIPTQSRKFYVLSGGTLHPMPEGMFLTVPTKIWPFLKNGLISFGGKMRMAMDLVLPRGKVVPDESIGAFIRRRLGNEALEKLAGPIMAGIYVAGADDLSLQATFPRFAEMEREHRSLIKAMRKLPVTGPASPFLSLRGGMGALVEALLAAMKGVTFLTGREVTRIDPGWKVHLGETILDGDAVILAIPAYAASAFWPGVPDIKYVTTSTVSLAYAKTRDLDGTGFVIPRGEERKILACTWTSSKFEGRAPADRLLIRCFLKGDASDIEKVAQEEIREILGLEEKPLKTWSFTWPKANPVYEVGHQERIKDFEATLPAGLHLCGSGFHGTGIPDCVRDGREVAKKIL